MPVRFDALSEGLSIKGLGCDGVSTFGKRSDDGRICLGKRGESANPHFFNNGGNVFEPSASDTISQQYVVNMSVGHHAVCDHVSEPLAQASAVACVGMCHQDRGIVKYIRSVSTFGVSRKVVMKISKDDLNIPIVSVREKSQPNGPAAGYVSILQGLERSLGTGGIALAGEQMKGGCEKKVILVVESDACRYLGEKYVCLLDGMTLDKGSNKP